MAADYPALAENLRRLSALAPNVSDRRSIDELLRRVGHSTVRIIVAGEAKRGKSTLINALLRQPILPSGVVPLTAIPTTITYGEHDAVEVRLRTGEARLEPVDHIGRFVTEESNPENILGVDDVVVSVRNPLLSGVELVDTPGTGSIFRHNTDSAVAARERMDAAVVVLSVDPPISDSERMLIEEINETAVTTWYVLNKVDRLNPAELRTAVEFTRSVIASLTRTDATVWPMSALNALTSSAGTPASKTGSEGFEAWAAEFTRYLETSAGRDLEQSVAGRAERLALSIKDRDNAALASLEIADERVESALALFAGRLASLDEDRAATSALAETLIREMITETGAAAADLAVRATPELDRQITSCLANGSIPPKALETDGLRLTTDLIRGVVDEWRTRWRAELNRRLQAANREITSRLERHVAGVRSTAAELFGLDLSAYTIEADLLERTAFSYRFEPAPGQYDTMAATARRVLPAPLTRRWTEGYLRRRSHSLLDQQIGRARSEFQAELSETARQLQAALRQQYHEGAGSIVESIEVGQQIRTAEAGGSAQTRAQLRRRAEQATRLAEQFGGARRPQD